MASFMVPSAAQKAFSFGKKSNGSPQVLGAGHGAPFALQGAGRHGHAQLAGIRITGSLRRFALTFTMLSLPVEPPLLAVGASPRFNDIQRIPVNTK